ncbi:hypothetical protein ACJX0J_042523, partial [Zea mays]
LTACFLPASGRHAPAAVRNYDFIPKREPFTSSRSTLDEFLRLDKPLVQRTRDQITGCSGERAQEENVLAFEITCLLDSYSSNAAQQDLPKEEISRMVKDSEGDVRYLIESIHHRSDLRKKMAEKSRNSVPSSSQGQTAKPRPFPVPDGIPITQEELTEALMPESSYTRLLRRMGRYPEWYTARPDHETD